MYPPSARRLTPEETLDAVRKGRAILAADARAREQARFEDHLPDCLCRLADSDGNRRDIEALDNVITAGFRAFVQPKFSSYPEVEVSEGHQHLVIRHGFSAGGHVYTLTLQQES